VTSRSADDYGNDVAGIDGRFRITDQHSLEPAPPHASAYLSLQHENQEGERVFDAQLSDFRLTWQFNLRSFLRFTAQRQHVKRNVALFLADTDTHTLTVGSQLLYSYKLNPQTVFFLGYSDNYIDDDRYDDLTRTDRTLFIKLAYAWAP